MRVSRFFMGMILFSGLLGCAAEVSEADAATWETDESALVEASTAARVTLKDAVTETCDESCLVRQWIIDERYEEAREVLAAEANRVPDDVETHLLLAATNMRDEMYEKAYELADRLIPVHDDVRLRETRAYASLLAHDVETAAHDFNDTIEALQSFEPETRRIICDAVTGHCAAPMQREAYAWLGLATAEYNRQDLERASEIVDDLMNADAFAGAFEPSAGQFIRALVASKRGDDNTAKAHYEAILAKFPNDPASLVNLGGIAYRSGDLETARRMQTQAYEYAGSHRRTAAIAWSNVAEIDMLEGQYEAALDKANEAILTSRNYAGGYFQLAVIHDVIGNGAESLRAMKHALELDTQGVSRWNIAMFNADWEAHFAGLIAEAEGRTESASRHWHTLLGSDDETLQGIAKRHLSSLYERSGEHCPR